MCLSLLFPSFISSRQLVLMYLSFSGLIKPDGVNELEDDAVSELEDDRFCESVELVIRHLLYTGNIRCYSSVVEVK